MYTTEQLAERVTSLEKEVNELKGIIKQDEAALKRIEKLLLSMQEDLSKLDDREQSRHRTYGTTRRW